MDILSGLSEVPYNGGGKQSVILGNKKYLLLYDEVEIDESLDHVWDEVAGNFINGGEIAESINSSKGLTGDLISGLGAERYLNINFQGRNLEVKERIIDFKEEENLRKFTYDVYESKGAPLKIKTYNTWSARLNTNGKTTLGNLFILRATPSFLSSVVRKKLKQSNSIRIGLLTYKHYLETGNKRVDGSELLNLYPKQ